MALVLGATGVFIYLRFSSELDATIDSGLRSRAGDLASLVRQAGTGPRGSRGSLVGREENFAQVLGASGRVADSSPSVGGSALLDRGELRRALQGPITLDRGPRPGLRSPASAPP
jgi:hypothetical protein